MRELARGNLYRKSLVRPSKDLYSVSYILKASDAGGVKTISHNMHVASVISSCGSHTLAHMYKQACMTVRSYIRLTASS